LIVLDGAKPQALWLAARQLQEVLQEQAGVAWEIVAAASVPADQQRAVLRAVPGSTHHSQGYRISINQGQIEVTASQPAGVFYAVQTLRQLIQQIGNILPTLRCRDWPDFPQRGVLLDISRDKVPTRKTLLELVDRLSSWKINQLQLYTEHTFAYRNHPKVWAEASPVTGEDILALDAYCQERFVELVPNQNTFGHMARWLCHPAYRHLAECPDGCETAWGFLPAFSLSPAVAGSIELVRDLLDELLPHFRSSYVNVGCDETFDLGQGRSKGLVAERGVGQVYLDFLLAIYREVKSRGRRMQFWGDIVMEHPELVHALPGDAIALEWGYEADHPFADHGARFAASGVPFYVCPGTSSWRTVAGRTDNAVANLESAAKQGLAHGAVGYLVTDWGDEGHWQPLPVSYLGWLYGAALAWAHDVNVAMDLPAALSTHIFLDRANKMGALAHELGNVYQDPGILIPNSSVLFNVLQMRPAQVRRLLEKQSDVAGLSGRLDATLLHIDQILADLPDARMDCVDADLVAREFVWAANMLRHACHRLRWILDRSSGPEVFRQLDQGIGALVEEFGAIWQARNRPGGFTDSVARLELLRDEYGVA
jgi:hypothetical protein